MKENMLDIEFKEPWVRVEVYPENLEDELRREIASTHVLWNRKVHAIAQRTDSDHVLFEIEDEIPYYAVVHLTWSGEAETDPQWPHTFLFPSITEWIRDGLLADHRKFHL